MPRDNQPIVLLAACGLAGSTIAPAATALAQSDPLAEPFAAEVDLRDYRDLEPEPATFGLIFRGTPGERVGFSVASIGDINNDGLDDLAVGSMLSSPGGVIEAGRAYVLFGRPAGDPFEAATELADLDGTRGFRIDGFQTYANAGAPTVGAGDINGDGIDDILIGARDASPRDVQAAGAAYVVYGRDSTMGEAFPPVLSLDDLDGNNGFAIWGSAEFGRLGRRVAPIGDLNGDGLDDVAIGAYRESAGGLVAAGWVYVLFGSDAPGAFPPVFEPVSLDGGNGFKVPGDAAQGQLGVALGSAGDVNGDGLPDMIIGADQARPLGRFDAGASYVIFGRAAGATPFPASLTLDSLDGTTGFALFGAAAGDLSGSSVGVVGDVNGDGLDDIAIGSEEASHGGERATGEAAIIFGRRQRAGEPPVFPATIDLADLDSLDGFRVLGSRENDLTGSSVAGPGDLNGDGFDDAVIGAVAADPREYRRNAGETYVIFGKDTATSGPFASTIRSIDLDGENGFTVIGAIDGDLSGSTVAPAGDVNQDGKPDLFIASTRADLAGASDAGSGYVVFGRQPASCPADLDGDGELTIFDFLEFGNLFDLMDPAADFDGDGDFTIFDFLAFQNAFDAGCP